MKKMLALSFLVIVALSFHCYSTTMELRAMKEIKAKELLGLMKERQEMYTKLETGTLREPAGTESEDIIDRIVMLRSHLAYQPSLDWIRDVVTAAEIEINALRNRP